MKVTFFFCSTVLVYLTVTSADIKGNGELLFDAKGDGSVEMALKNEGLGIFTNSPSQSLEVSGDSVISKGLTVKGDTRSKDRAT